VNPYNNLDAKFFWAPAVAQKNMFDISDLWLPKFEITKNTKIATYGSCFAQHIGKALKENGFNWIDAEQPPKGVDEGLARNFNYGIFTARTGNIYTASLLRQWVNWSLGIEVTPAEIWESENRFFDPFRPNIEVDGFSSHEELVASRNQAINSFKSSLVKSDIFVFTLGLTECWRKRLGGYEYPMCPGTVGGEFNPNEHEFINAGFPMIYTDLLEAFKLMRSVNPSLKFLLTVSPVPLTATMSGKHVLVASMESKSILRTVAGALSKSLSFVDYFPSYEIISSTPFRATFFEANLRSVNHMGVEHVMRSFFSCLKSKASKINSSKKDRAINVERDKISSQINGTSRIDPHCDEEILSAFFKS
jgi:hypothetical protein